MIRKNLYIFILAALFLGAAKILFAFGFWGVIGLHEPEGYIAQGLIFLALLFVLQNLLFGPYLEVAEERENLTTKKKAAAEKTRESADRMIADYRKKIEETWIRATMERERIALTAEAEERIRIVGAKKAGSQYVSDAIERLEKEAESVRPELAKQVDSLAGEIVEQIAAGALPPRTRISGSPLHAANKG